tara:strand:+ start:151 stop:378 length:228 start_codon:yes stop_codon:yes gene_type:complete
VRAGIRSQLAKILDSFVSTYGVEPAFVPESAARALGRVVRARKANEIGTRRGREDFGGFGKVIVPVYCNFQVIAQ